MQDKLPPEALTGTKLDANPPSHSQKHSASSPYRMLTDSEKQSLRARAKWVADWAKQQLKAQKQGSLPPLPNQ